LRSSAPGGDAQVRLVTAVQSWAARREQRRQEAASRQLRLDGNRLTALPPEIGQLTNLRQLTFRHNQLTALPPEIAQLTKLLGLRLDGNQLTALPPEITLGLPGTRRLTQARQPAPGPLGHEIQAVRLSREALAAGLQEPGERVQLRLVALDRSTRSACRAQRGDHPR